MTTVEKIAEALGTPTAELIGFSVTLGLIRSFGLKRASDAEELVIKSITKFIVRYWGK